MSTPPDDFLAKAIGTYLAELTDNAAENVGKTLANLWRKRDGQDTSRGCWLEKDANEGGTKAAVYDMQTYIERKVTSWTNCRGFLSL